MDVAQSTWGLGRGPLAAMLVLSLGLVLAGCVGTRGQQSAAPVEEVRATATTAPADLQLLCASQAATDFGVDSNQVLPVASAPAGDNSFNVQLNVAGGSATCVVDQNGSILSLARA